MVLVLDDTTYDYIFSLIQKSDALRIFSVVTKVDSPKTAQPSLNALYLLSPSTYSIRCLLTDFESTSVKYKGAHLYFLPTVSQSQEKMIKSNFQLNPRILSFGEFPLDFEAKDPNVFTLKNPKSLQTYYNSSCSDLVKGSIDKIASSLVGICVLTGEYPIIRYYSPNTEDFNAAVLPKFIAGAFQFQLDEYSRKNPDFPPVTDRPRSVFVITDRTCDLYAPLLHEFTYQAMAYDLLPIDEGGKFTYEVENESGTLIKRDAILNEDDQQWMSLKNLHISDAEESWKLSFKEFTSKYSKFINRSGKVSVSDIRTLAAGTEEFNEARTRIVLHDKMIVSLLKINNVRNLAELAELEQDLISNGCDINGDRIKNIAVSLLEVLQKCECLQSDKLRLVIVYFIYRGGLIEEDLVKLFHFMEISTNDFPSVLSYFQNLQYLGFTGVKKSPKSKSSGKRTFLHESSTGDVFNTSRFKPAMNTIISRIVDNSLDESIFPYIKDKPIQLDDPSPTTSSLKNPRHRAAWGKQSHAYEAPKQRIFYYIAGGATLSEVRTASELSNLLDKQVILGSDELLTPGEFISNLALLSTDDRNQLNLPQDRQRFLSERQVPAELRMRQSVSPSPVQTPQSTGPQKPTVQREVTPTDESSSATGKRARFKKFLRG
ncbi:hypothetical protein WICPIJ_005799 [Wickerhamomyces pijperi]|uniref:Uncharacterized protein n=1 Tax=Wickerhamomyces pijperi TaxID=599730 RepID=A0A9P8TKS1_WICPI|nr:hypothetical protein WICPIJ_005799 [Wickerhamomyces pijperi]